jgi:hypothetical protein
VFFSYMCFFFPTSYSHSDFGALCINLHPIT